MSRQRSILHLIAKLDGYGEANQLRLLVQQQLAAGWEVSVVALAADREVGAALEAAGAACRVLDRRWTIDPFAAGRLLRELRNSTADLIHVWGPEALYYAVVAGLGSTKMPRVATFAQAPAGKAWPVPWFQRLDGRIDRVVVSSRPVGRSCVAAGLADEKKMCLIPPGVAKPRSDRWSRDRLLAELDLPGDARLIAIASRLTRTKHIDDAIWCFELVRIFNTHARLLVFGDGPERQRLERFARLVSDPQAIRFLGFRGEMVDFLPLMDIFWQAGEEAATPTALLEAMAAGLPVVATDVPVHREIIDNGHTGHLVPVGHRALRARVTGRLLQGANLAETMGLAAKERVRRFSVEAMSRAYADLYDDLLLTE